MTTDHSHPTTTPESAPVPTGEQYPEQRPAARRKRRPDDTLAPSNTGSADIRTVRAPGSASDR